MISRFLLRFYVPIIVGVTLIGLGLSADLTTGSSGIPVQISVGLASLNITIPIPAYLSKEWAPILIFVGAGGSAILIGIMVDFSKFFPEKIQMDVFFDIDGLQQALVSFREDELSLVHIDPEWRNRIEIYDNLVRITLIELSNTVSPEQHILDFSLFNRDTLHAHGSATFRVERIGLLSYRMLESQGYLDHTVDAPHSTTIRFKTEFSLRSTRHDHLRPKIKDLFYGLVLRPEFKQILRIGTEAMEAKIFDHTVIGLTRIKIFPFPSFSSTIYLWNQEGTQTTVPVAYVIYY